MKNNKNELIVKQKDDNTFYQIIITSQNKIMLCVFKTMYKKSAILAFDKITSSNKSTVRFPVRYSSRDHKLIPAKYELLLMKTKIPGDSNEPLFRNEFGKLVPNISNSSKMIIYKKEEYLFEETFWVYGMNPRSQRKNFNYILNDIIINPIKNKHLLKSKYPVLNIFIYRNKLIIENDDDFDIIICKCENDAARLYTEIKKESDINKIKCIFFSGFVKDIAKKRIEDRILHKTGWTIQKVRRKSTRP
jgi:hypothetical protein